MNGEVKLPEDLSDAAMDKMFWRGVAWLPVIRLTYILLASFEGYSSHVNLLEHLGFFGLAHLLIVDIGLIIPLFLFAYQKYILNPMFWKTYFWVALLVDVPPTIASTVADFAEFSHAFLTIFPFQILSYIFYIPAYVALYKYAFHQSERTSLAK